MGVCESTQSKQENEYNQWKNETRGAQASGLTPEYRQAQEIAKEATDVQIAAHEARKAANEAEEKARKLENRARMMIHAAAEATSSALAAKEPQARVPPGKLGEIIQNVSENSDKHLTLELYGQGEAMSSEVGVALAEALANNTQVKTVNIANGNVGDSGTIKLCKTLVMNRTIHTLNLKSNALGDDGALAIADMLRNNTSLTYLNVGNQADKMDASNTNTIGNHGLKAICDALCVNSTLKKVVFNNLPRVDNFGAKAVMAMVEVNRGLTDVYLEGKTGIDNQQRQAMRKGNNPGGAIEEDPFIT